MGDTDAGDRDALKPVAWTTLGDEALLDVRLCDLGLTIEGTDLEPRIAQLNAEIEARGLGFRPHYWLSDD